MDTAALEAPTMNKITARTKRGSVFTLWRHAQR